MTTFAVTSVSSLLCQAPTCFRIGSKLRCIRSTPTDMQSMSEDDFECFANTSVNAPGTMSPKISVLPHIHLNETLAQPLPTTSLRYFQPRKYRKSQFSIIMACENSEESYFRLCEGDICCQHPGGSAAISRSELHPTRLRESVPKDCP